MSTYEKYIPELPRILLIFVFGGVFGFLYELIFYRIDLGYFVKRGTTLGPWIPIYAFGAVAILLLTKALRKQPWKVFLLSVVIAGVLEFFTGLILYEGFGVRLWDYNNEIWNWGNIGGYICFRSLLFFGVSALFLQYLVYPILCRITDKLNKKTMLVISIVPAALFVLDIIAVLIRGSIFSF